MRVVDHKAQVQPGDIGADSRSVRSAAGDSGLALVAAVAMPSGRMMAPLAGKACGAG